MGAGRDLGKLLTTYWSLFLGNSVEWYEFAVYAYMAMYIQKYYFRGSELGTWVGFAFTFIARPIGGLVFGVIADKFGRSVSVNLSIAGMMIGTAGQGMLPAFSNTGLAMLVILRFMQGLCAAGEISTISTYITEVGSKASIGKCIALIGITCNVGFLGAKAVVYSTLQVFGKEAMDEWAWRLPFILAVIPGLLSLLGRRCLPESEAYLMEMERQKEAKEESVGACAQVGKVFSTHSINVALGMGAVAGFAVFQYGGFLWTQAYLAHHGASIDARMLASLVSRVIMMVLAIPVGHLIDVKGVGWVTLVGAFCQAVLSLPLWALLSADPKDSTILVWVLGVAFALLGSINGTGFFYFVVELFPVSIRAAGVGVSYNLGFSIFGGLAPILAQEAVTIDRLGPGFVLSLAGVVSAFTVIAGLGLQRRGKVQLAHVRPYPYFGKDDGAFKDIKVSLDSESANDDSDVNSSESDSSE